jgi:hypothetical protein
MENPYEAPLISGELTKTGGSKFFVGKYIRPDFPPNKKERRIKKRIGSSGCSPDSTAVGLSLSKAHWWFWNTVE